MTPAPRSPRGTRSRRAPRNATRELFRWAADWVAAHAVDDLDAIPAFRYSPAREPSGAPTAAATSAAAGDAATRARSSAEDPSRPASPLAGNAAHVPSTSRGAGASAAPDMEDRSPRASNALRLRTPTGAVPRSVADIAGAIREGRVTATEVVETCLTRIARLDGQLRAFVTVTADAARAEAERCDAERRAGHVRGPLHGVPISVKDVIHVAGVPTTASSRVLGDLTPSRDATSVARLRAAGAIVIGKTETHEFALGVTTPQSRNPWDPTRIPGGSTGGSAIAIVTGMAPGAVGTDTRASIRVPAALSGVVGFKPTFGLVPTDGVVTLSWSMDHVAPMAATIHDAALLLDVLAGADPRRSYRAFAGAPIAGLRIGLPRAAFEGAEPVVADAVRRALDGLSSEGAVLVPVDEPSAGDLEMTNAAGMIVSRAEAATFHRRWLAERAESYTPETFAQLDEASRVPAPIYLAAQRLREQFRQRMLALLAEIDALAMPTSLVLAPKVDEAERFLLVLSRNCIPWSFIGVPAVSLPCGRSASGLPIGLQLVAPPHEDGRLVALGTAAERVVVWNGCLPA